MDIPLLGRQFGEHYGFLMPVGNKLPIGTLSKEVGARLMGDRLE